MLDFPGHVKNFLKNGLLFLIGILLSGSGYLFAQDSLETNVKKAPLKTFSISGNYRFYGQHRIFTDAYTVDMVNDEPVSISIVPEKSSNNSVPNIERL